MQVKEIKTRSRKGTPPPPPQKKKSKEEKVSRHDSSFKMKVKLKKR
jgi:hypothetical protein